MWVHVQSKPTKTKSPTKIGSLGHLTRIANRMIQASASNSTIKAHLQVYSRITARFRSHFATKWWLSLKVHLTAMHPMLKVNCHVLRTDPKCQNQEILTCWPADVLVKGHVDVGSWMNLQFWHNMTLQVLCCFTIVVVAGTHLWNPYSEMKTQAVVDIVWSNWGVKS
jgi:hypothetical protein